MISRRLVDWLIDEWNFDTINQASKKDRKTKYHQKYLGFRLRFRFGNNHLFICSFIWNYTH